MNGGRGATALPTVVVRRPVTDILVGASFGDAPWSTNSFPTSVTSMAFHPLTADDATDQERDGDGLSLIDELFAFGTAPDMWDTDGDGLSASEEVALGTDQLVIVS